MIGFDFGNELNTCWSAPVAAGDAWMKKMFALMNEVLPDRAPRQRRRSSSLVLARHVFAEALAAARFPVMHCYPWWTGAMKYGEAMDPPSVKLLAAMAALIRSYAGSSRKRYGPANSIPASRRCLKTGRREWLEKAVHAAIEEGVSWFSYWDSHDVDRKFEFNPLEYSLGLLTNDGRVKAQGRVFKQLADTYRGKPVVFPKRGVPAPPREPTGATWAWLLDWMGWKPKTNA